MADDRLESVLEGVDPGKRTFLKKLIVGTAFAVPTIASYSVKDLSLAEAASHPSTSIITLTLTE